MTNCRFSVLVGVLSRGIIKRNILGLSDACKIECTVTEEKGLIESLYRFSCEGEEAKLEKFLRLVKDMTEELL